MNLTFQQILDNYEAYHMAYIECYIDGSSTSSSTICKGRIIMEMCSSGFYIIHDNPSRNGGRPSSSNIPEGMRELYRYGWHIGSYEWKNEVTLIKLEGIDINAMLQISKRLYLKLDTERFVSIKKNKGNICFNNDKVLYIGKGLTYLNIEVGDKAPNCFDIRKGEISYFKGVQPIEKSGKWGRDGRQVMKPSKFLNIIKDCFNVKVETIADGFTEEEAKALLLKRGLEIIGENAKALPIDILVSSDVESIYNTEESNGSIGTLGNSCMRYGEDYRGREYLSAYNDIGNKIAYTLDNEGYLLARALLWEGVTNEDTKQKFNFMDRIYGTEANIEAFKEWAEENGYAYKQEQSYSNTTLVLLDGALTNKYHLPSGLIRSEIKGLPYFDSFNYMDEDLILHSKESSLSNSISLQETDGGIFANNRHECQCCGEYFDEDDIYYANDTGNDVCEECCAWSDLLGVHLENYVQERVDGEYEYLPIDWDGTTSRDTYYNIDGEWYSSDNVYECNECGDLFHVDDTTYDEETGCDYCNECYADIVKQRNEKE